MHLSDYFTNLELEELENVFERLHEHKWTIQNGRFVDRYEVEWEFNDMLGCSINEDAFYAIVTGYKLFLENISLLEKTKVLTETLIKIKHSDKFQQELNSNLLKIESLEEQNNSLKEELSKYKELSNINTSQQVTKDFVSLRRSKFIKLE